MSEPSPYPDWRDSRRDRARCPRCFSHGTVWRVHFAREQDGRLRWRQPAELPPVGERLQSPCDPEMHYSTKRAMEWSGYQVHITESCDDDAAHLITPHCPEHRAALRRRRHQ